MPENRDNNQLVALAALGLAGYFAYEKWYGPQQRTKRAAEALAEQIAETQAANPGMSAESALQTLGKTACQGVALSYGVPPAMSGDVCGLAVQLAPKILKATYQGVSLAAKYGSRGVKQVGRGAVQVGKTITRIPGSVAKHAVTRPAKQIGRGIKKLLSF